MDPKERERKIDAWLDDALAHYNDAEPRPGLEQRVLANGRAEERKPRRRWWMVWTPAFAAVIAVVVVVVAVRQKEEVAPRAVVPAQVVHQEAPSAPRVLDESARQAKEEPKRSLRGTTDSLASAVRPKRSGAAEQKMALKAQSVTTDSGRESTVAEATAAMDTTRAARMQARVGNQPQLMTAPAAAPIADGKLSESPRAFSAMGAGRANVAAESAGVGTRDLVPLAGVTAGLADVRGTEVFPAPAPLSEQEKLIVKATRSGVSLDVPQLPPRDEPLPQVQIQDIRIKPLQVAEK